MTNRTNRATSREKTLVEQAIASHNARIAATHAALIKEIRSLRPTWDVSKLEAVGKTYGSPSAPGLHDILETLKAAAELDRRFEVAR